MAKKKSNPATKKKQTQSAPKTSTTQRGKKSDQRKQNSQPLPVLEQRSSRASNSNQQADNNISQSTARQDNQETMIYQHLPNSMKINQQEEKQLNEVIALRMNRESVNTGELHATLIWNDIADLDIHVICPSGEHIYFGHKESACGGWLDVDMNAREDQISLEPIENIFWATSPSGHYKFYVNNYHNRTDSKTVFTDSLRKVPFRVRLRRGETIDWFQGSCGPNENITCFEFDHTGSGAVGSFVVLPPSDKDSTFKDMCAFNKVTYNTGSGFYAVKRTENVSAKKDMILHKESNDTFIIGPVECRRYLNLPLDQNIKIKPSDIPQGHRLFVQSTSHNRKIPKDTHVLVKVPMVEALKFRKSDKYKFK